MRETGGVDEVSASLRLKGKSLEARREAFVAALREHVGKTYDDVDCCALVKLAQRSVAEEGGFSFYLGEWNHGYQRALFDATAPGACN